MNKKIKGLVGGIQKFSTEDGPGIRTTVFLKGCPLACRWCHNPELIDPRQQIVCNRTKCIGCRTCLEVCPQQAISFDAGLVVLDRSTCDRCLRCTEACYAEALAPVGRWMNVEEVLAQVRQDIGFYQHTGGGLTISGGELLTQADFSHALIQASMEEHINVTLDTCGYGDYDSLYTLAAKCSHILFDIKHIHATAHQHLTGKDNASILKNLAKLAADPCIKNKIIVRMPLLQGINDTEKVIEETQIFLLQHNLKKVTLLPYHDLGIGKCRNIGQTAEIFSPPAEERLNAIQCQFEAVGICTEILGQNLPGR